VNGRLARMEIAVYPLGTGEASVTREVAEIFPVLEASGLHYRVGEMGTTAEGTADELFALARRLHDAVLGSAARRVVTMIKLDESIDGEESPVRVEDGE
jgi:uncharacterized protein (TIGR00106 family)